MGSFRINAFAMGNIATADDLVDKGAVRVRSSKSVVASHQQGIMNGVFEMTVQELSIEPFSWATPLLLRVGVIR